LSNATKSSATSEVKLSRKRLLAQLDLAYFSECLGYENSRHQLELYQALQSPDLKRILVLWPPGHGKTTCAGVNYPTWLVGKNPNLRIIETSHTADFVTSFSREISATLQRPEYTQIFGQLKPYRPTKWSESELLVRRRFEGKDPTFRFKGTGEATIGPRADDIICDDIIDRKRASSAIYRESIERWFNKELMSRLEPDGRILVIGTTWHWADLHVKLSKDPEWTNPKLGGLCLRRPAIDENNRALWEKRWPLDILLKRKSIVGSIDFAAQWQLEPSPAEGAEFSADWLNYYDPQTENPLERIFRLPSVQRMRITQVWDLAISESPEAAYTVGLTLGTSMEGDIYVLNISRGHWSFPAMSKRIEADALAWNPVEIGIESNGFQRIIAQGLRPKLLPIIEIKTTKNKLERIRGLSANFENGRIRISKGMDELIMEYLQFPNGETVDILDALEMGVSRIVVGIRGNSGGIVSVKRQ
jgi:hypothetical protein